MKLKRKGFTLTELMITVAVVAILAAIAIPNFAKARNSSITVACQANAKQLQTALDRAVLDVGGNTTDEKNLTEQILKLIVYPDYVKTMPDCTSGDYYTDASGNVMCSSHNAASGSVGGTAADPPE